MKTESRLMWVIAVFFAIMTVIYTIATANSEKGIEPAGVVGLMLTAGLFAMCGFFFWNTGRKIDLRPDDDLDGEISDVEGDFGFFAPYSWWPLFLGGALGLMTFGAAVGWWLVIIAMPLVALAVIGWTFEFFHGEDAI